jgi:hypothetical protein
MRPRRSNPSITVVMMMVQPKPAKTQITGSLLSGCNSERLDARTPHHSTAGRRQADTQSGE